RPPLGSTRQAQWNPVRLACLTHPASVCPEPGSNSPNKKQWSCPKAPPPLTVQTMIPLTFVWVPVTLQLLRSRTDGVGFVRLKAPAIGTPGGKQRGPLDRRSCNTPRHTPAR